MPERDAASVKPQADSPFAAAAPCSEFAKFRVMIAACSHLLDFKSPSGRQPVMAPFAEEGLTVTRMLRCHCTGLTSPTCSKAPLGGTGCPCWCLSLPGACPGQARARGARWCALTPRSAGARGPSRCSRWRPSGAAAAASSSGSCWRRRRGRMDPRLPGSAWTRRCRSIARQVARCRRVVKDSVERLVHPFWAGCWRQKRKRGALAVCAHTLQL